MWTVGGKHRRNVSSKSRIEGLLKSALAIGAALAFAGEPGWAGEMRVSSPAAPVGGASAAASPAHPARGAAAAAPTPSPNAAPTARPCTVDADCVVVPAGCCGCTEGGQARAVARKHADSYQRERRKHCAATMCPQMMSQHPSCTESAVCEEGACRLGAVKPAPPKAAPGK